jgi:NADH:ubiquinone oxidoreductase subunit K
MPRTRATRLLPATLVRAIVSLPLMLLATALWAAAHAEHPTVTDLAIQAMLVLFIAALFVNVVLSVVAILRERHVLDPPEVGGSSFVAELEQRSPTGSPSGQDAARSRTARSLAAARSSLSDKTSR